ncbi:thioredoxin domain-containing protein [Opitutus terrae]|uniref:Spermatogenesis-associated protein 20-like TRX domain-containing protein n=1 Tax=Opitutus terrae (strain DSM 11246 / JCM 15787 / PB90-1) TaxID=452637 RepID=B1ZUN0_OPITP|nr:thioredoxin domain-containing protein [Opitutus terrae]ACB74914.1 protein of unknown function DUF255 [Opitutus terrae PB90-1]
MPNALAQEKSPYLLQHADNPVNWLPWGEAAFAKARAEQKPIFLSIGYATCHWCHVMAHESFENEAVAQLLNESFVAIKVDREERPDVDRVYMTYVQAMTGHGGWPLSAWLTPDLKPFFGGTYFPPEDRQGRAGFAAILRAIAHGWSTEREKLVAEGERVIAALREHQQSKTADVSKSTGGESAGAEIGSGIDALIHQLHERGAPAFERGFQYFYEAFDPEHGGFGGAPKFPRASNLSFLFRAAALQGVASEAGAEAIRLASATLQAMARGGIHDHVGGGFHRYSVDERWFVPHFEKMLYDQAQIALNALEAKQATGDERFAWLARDILTYVLRDLAHPDGGFYSAEDADSAAANAEPGHGGKKVEGAFYVWAQSEIEQVLGDEARLVCEHFGVKPDGNVPGQLDPHGEFTGKNVLAQAQPLATTAKAHELTPEMASERLQAALERLRAVRAQRPRPLRDDKIITAWNGLMISALAKAHVVLELAEDAAETLYLGAATRTAEFVERELFDRDRAILFRSWRGGRSAVEGFAEDYAFMIQGLLDLYEAGFDVRWLQWAERLQATMDARFWDAEHGGYFNSASDDPHLVLRLKEDYDGAEPAPSSVAAMNLLRLGVMIERPGAAAAAGGIDYRERGLRTILAFQEQWSQTPQALPQMLCALERALMPPAHVVLAGQPGDEAFRALLRVVQGRLGSQHVLLVADGGEGQRWLSARAPWLTTMTPRNGQATAYVCEDFTCQAPVESPAALRDLLTR